MKATRRYAAGLAAIVTTAAGLLAATAGGASAGGFPAFVGPLHHTSVLASTVPGNGDVNPYGVAVVPRSTGDLFQGNVLVSNFNNKANAQGTGTTIVQVNPATDAVTQFAGISDPSCPGGVGLTTALVALRNGWVIVGSLPSTDGLPDGLDSAVVMLDPGFTAAGFDDPALTVFWGAYLSTADETLISGPLAEVADQITATKAELRARHGWIMDTYLLRRPDSR